MPLAICFNLEKKILSSGNGLNHKEIVVSTDRYWSIYYNGILARQHYDFKTHEFDPVQTA